MGKFALRGLAQSMARELSPQNIHVAHFVIDGVGAPERPVRGGRFRRQRTRSRRHRLELPRHPRPAAQRLNLGGDPEATGWVSKVEAGQARRHRSSHIRIMQSLAKDHPGTA
jgi:hypothetical protein